MAAPVLFIGPSGHGVSIDPALGLDVRPPARRGDLLRAAETRPSAMLLVDGEFTRAPAVPHKEILLVLEAGIPVIGAASLGALRAAELDGCGMTGVGKIYEAYRSGAETRDDAVLVEHAPRDLGYRPLTISLFDMLATVEALPSIEASAREGLRQAARTLFFRDRTWSALAAAMPGEAPDGRSWETFLAAHHQPVKQRDVAALLAFAASGLPAVPPQEPVPRNRFVRDLIAEAAAPQASARSA